MLKRRDIASSFVAGAAGPRSVAKRTLPWTALGIVTRLVETAAVTRSWTAAEAVEAAIPVSRKEIRRRRGREILRIDKSCVPKSLDRSVRGLKRAIQRP